MSNPLLEAYQLPPFARILPLHVVPAIQHILDDNRKAVAALLEGGGPYRLETLVAPMEELDDRLHKAWSPIGHLNSVANSD